MEWKRLVTNDFFRTFTGGLISSWDYGHEDELLSLSGQCVTNLNSIFILSRAFTFWVDLKSGQSLRCSSQVNKVSLQKSLLGENIESNYIHS